MAMAAALKTVLMIEDNPADVEIIREELAMARGTRFTVETASNLADGLTYIGEHCSRCAPLGHSSVMLTFL